MENFNPERAEETLKTNGKGQLVSLIESFYDIGTKQVAWSLDLLK